MLDFWSITHSQESEFYRQVWKNQTNLIHLIKRMTSGKSTVPMRLCPVGSSSFTLCLLTQSVVVMFSESCSYHRSCLGPENADFDGNLISCAGCNQFLPSWALLLKFTSMLHHQRKRGKTGTKLQSLCTIHQAHIFYFVSPLHAPMGPYFKKSLILHFAFTESQILAFLQL